MSSEGAQPAEPTIEGHRRDYLAALARTVPYTIVEAVLENPSEQAIRSTQFEGAILHADLVGFTAMCERVARLGSAGLGPLTGALNALFARLLEDCIFPYDGYVITFGGDSVTAVFRGEGHAQRAAAAALAACRQMEESPLGLPGEQGKSLLLRVGVVKGEVRLPIIGDLLQRTVVCAGASARKVVKLQHLAEPNAVMVDEALAVALGEQAILGEGRDGGTRLLGLRESPPRAAAPPLAGRIEEDTEKKIALLEPFVPEPLLARLRTTPLGWRVDGELRQVVLLFAEVSGFSGEGNDSTLVTDVSRSMLRAYRKYGGLIAKSDLSDDGHRVMVIFGLHMPSSNDAERALLAALETTARMKGYTAANASRVQLRTGIHAGEVYFGAFGSDLRHDVTVVGDAVNTAARLAGAARPFEILASEAALKGLSADFRCSAREPIRVKGKEQPLEVKVVHSTAEGVAHYMRTRSHERRLAGRDAEREGLREAAERALRGGRGEMVGLCGGPGTGKSALLSFAVDEWTRRGGLAMLGRCRYATRSEPLAPVVSMFSAFLGLTRGDDDQVRRDRIRGGLAPFQLAGGAPELLSLLMPVHRPDGATESLVDLADGHSRERLMSTLMQFFEQRTAQEPLLYVVEDLHFADSLTLELAHRVVALPRRNPFLFILTYRPDPLLASLRRSLDRELPLESLSPGDAERLIQLEVGVDAVDGQLLAFLHRRTGGNPGHLVDLVRFLRDRELLPIRAGTLIEPEGGLRFLDHLVPRSASHVALAQLDGLGEVERRLTRTASAIGRHFSQELLEDVSRGEVEPRLFGWAMDSLQGKQLIAPDTATRGYAFRDDSIRAAAYATLPMERRREIHRRIADALEARPDLDPSRHAASLAVHRERAGQWKEAARWFERAALAALRAGLNEEARQMVDRFRAACAQLSAEDRPPPQKELQLSLVRLAALGRSRLASETADQARALLGRFGPLLDASSRVAAELWLGCALAWLGETAPAQELLEGVHARAEDRAMRFDAALQLAQLRGQGGDVLAARRWLGEAAALTGADPYLEDQIELARTDLRWASERSPGLCEAYERLLEKARPLGQLRLALRAARGAARCRLHRGELERARVGFEEAIRLARAVHDWPELAASMVQLGQTHLWEGHPDRARTLLEEALAAAREAAAPQEIAEATVHLGAAVALTADPVEGRVLCEEGQALARRLGLAELILVAELHLCRIAVRWGEKEGIAAALARCAGVGELESTLLRGALEELRASAGRVE